MLWTDERVALKLGTCDQYADVVTFVYEMRDEYEKRTAEQNARFKQLTAFYEEREKKIMDLWMDREIAKEETGFWQSAASGLIVNYLMRARNGSDAISFDVDFNDPDAGNKIMNRIFAGGIPSGAYAENGVSLGTVSRICKELGAPDVVKDYFDDMDEALAQNRRFVESDEDERSQWN